MADKTEGLLMFDIGTAKFWLVDEENTDNGIKAIEFNDKFEVLVDDKWVETYLKIDSNDSGELIFKLANTNFDRDLNGTKIRL